MKDKNIAGILALFLGGFGVHQFYLNQAGMGIAHLFFAFNFRAWTISWLFAWATAISIFTMDQEKFDQKYNKGISSKRRGERGTTDFERRGTRDKREREDRWEAQERLRREREAINNRRSEKRQKRNDYSRTKTPKRSKPNPFKQAGIAKFKDYDYEGAIEDFVKSLEIAPEDIATHFNLACAYSLNEEAEKAFDHLDKAVRLGFKDVKKIKEHDALAFIRIQDEFEAFEENGFKLDNPTSKVDAPEEDLLSTTPDLLDQLKKLGELKEKGLLTEEEFVSQKEKLLNK
ncbi:MAG: NINE protein [Bacteroidetes bacterium]|jgi:TM2 domain-containing membrane protein YozV|nr:NINE protein [Bacteroidota bacterium]MDF1866976.1 NINE protein [Saprospiraceae bacterium]